MAPERDSVIPFIVFVVLLLLFVCLFVCLFVGCCFLFVVVFVSLLLLLLLLFCVCVCVFLLFLFLFLLGGSGGGGRVGGDILVSSRLHVNIAELFIFTQKKLTRKNRKQFRIRGNPRGPSST